MFCISSHHAGVIWVGINNILQVLAGNLILAGLQSLHAKLVLRIQLDSLFRFLGKHTAQDPDAKSRPGPDEDQKNEY